METKKSNEEQNGNLQQGVVRRSLSGKIIADYDKMKPQIHVNIPGCYCNACGETFALYYYSANKPTKKDENGIPYYDECFKCYKGDDKGKNN